MHLNLIYLFIYFRHLWLIEKIFIGPKYIHKLTPFSHGVRQELQKAPGGVLQFLPTRSFPTPLASSTFVHLILILRT